MPGPSLALHASLQGAAELKARMADRLTHLRPVMSRAVDRVRHGPEGLAEQISRREMNHLGRRKRWTEPFYVHGSPSRAALASEAILWRAELGGAGGGSRVTDTSAILTVSESVVGQLLAALGNGIISPDRHQFEHITGGFFVRTTPINLPALKPVNPVRNPKAGNPPTLEKPRPGPIGSRKAMFWWVWFNYGISLKDAVLVAGIPTDPKNTGISDLTVGWFRDAVIDHALGAGSLARGRANDPRARAA